jgi:hypothetical protein
MLKHLLVGAFTLSSTFALARPHQAVPVASPPPAPVVAVAPPPPMGFEDRRDRRDERRDERRDDRRDERRAQRLLADFDDALARRDFRRAEAVERQFSRYLAEELDETRAERHARKELRALRDIEFRLARLEGRRHPRAVFERRELYARLVMLAEHERAGRF